MAKRGDLESNVGNNLKNLLKDMGWTQQKLSTVMDMGEATVSSYVKGKMLPSVTSLVNLCEHTDIKRKYRLTIDQLLFESLDFEKTSVPLAMRENQAELHSDYIGNYFMYFFDQSSLDVIGGVRESRRLRYGVISIYNYMKRVGDEGIFAHAKFFKTLDDARQFKMELDDVMVPEVSGYADKVIEQYRKDREYYTGELTFNDNHTFIDISSGYYEDKALIVLCATQKKADRHYIGGLGTVVSVSHGTLHMPVAQKIILSAPELNVSAEELGKHLRIEPDCVQISDEADELLRMYQKLYGAGSNETSAPAAFLDEYDKRAIFTSRLSQLVKNSVDKDLNCVCAVTEKDDSMVYQMIKRCVVSVNKEII